MHHTFPPLEAIRKTLIQADASPLTIYKETGLTPSWQQAFREGRVKDPGYKRVCDLVIWLQNNSFQEFTQNVLTVTKDQ